MQDRRPMVARADQGRRGTPGSNGRRGPSGGWRHPWRRPGTRPRDRGDFRCTSCTGPANGGSSTGGSSSTARLPVDAAAPPTPGSRRRTPSLREGRSCGHSGHKDPSSLACRPGTARANAGPRSHRRSSTERPDRHSAAALFDCSRNSGRTARGSVAASCRGRSLCTGRGPGRDRDRIGRGTFVLRGVRSRRTAREPQPVGSVAAIGADSTRRRAGRPSSASSSPDAHSPRR